MSVRRNTLWNLFGSAGPMLLGIVAIPLLLKELGIERLGVLTLIWALIGYFSIFDFGLGRALTQKISALREASRSGDIDNTIRAGLVLMIAAGAIGAVLVVSIFAVGGATWLGVSQEIYHETYWAVMIAGIGIPVTTITSGLKGVIEGFEDFRLANFLRIILGTANFVVPVLVVRVIGPDLPSIVTGLVLARFLVMSLHVVAVYKRVATPFRKPYKIHSSAFSGLFRFGAWMTLSNIISPLMVVADRFIISHFAGSAVVAYYTIPNDFLIRLLVLPAAFTTALFPAMSRSIVAKKGETNELYAKSLRTVLYVLLAVVLGVVATAYHGLYYWLGADFADNSYVIAVVLAVGILFNGMAQVPHSLLQAAGDVKRTSLIHSLEFILYMPLLVLAVMHFGIVGGAVMWTARAAGDFLLLAHYARLRLALSTTING